MKKFKILIDVLLFIVTVLLFNIELIGNLNHEILGITLGVLIIIHVLLNFKWIKQVTKNLKIESEKLKKVIYIIYIIIVLLIAMYFLYTLTHSFQWLYAFS